MGFKFDSIEESLLWIKYKFFESGISPTEFRKCQMRDIRDIMDIKNSIDQRMMREQKIQNMIGKMK